MKTKNPLLGSRVVSTPDGDTTRVDSFVGALDTDLAQRIVNAAGSPDTYRHGDMFVVRIDGVKYVVKAVDPCRR